MKKPKRYKTGLVMNPLKVNRRTLLKGMGVTVALGGKLLSSDKGEAIAAVLGPNVERYRSSCSVDCLHCNLTSFVVNKKVDKIESSEGFNVKVCLRGLSRTQWLNHPDRLKYPLKRVGEKGTGQFQQISWDEALDTTAEKLIETKAKLGNRGIFFLSGPGNMNALTNATGSAFFDFFGGATRAVGTLCCSAVTAAMVPMVGLRWIDTRDTIADSRYLLCWGNNPAVTMQVYFKEFMKAREKGAKIVVIDPRFSETAAKSDEWIPINPGTDIALALGMLNIIIKEKLYDQEFLLKHTGAPFLVNEKEDLINADGKSGPYLIYDLTTKKPVPHDQAGALPALSLAELPDRGDFKTVFDLIAAEVSQWTPEKTQEETDVPADIVTRLAREYATVKPAMIIQNMSGAQRTEFGTYVAASQIYLPIFTGSYGKAGGGLLDAGGVTQFLQVKPPVKAPAPTPGLGRVPISIMGQWIANDRPSKIGLWWIMTSNPVTQHPNTNAIKAAMRKVPFVVVADNMMTSTALYADMVLPVCTVFEETSLMAGVFCHYMQLMEKAVDPPGEAKSDVWIFTQLAKRLGFGEAFDKPIDKHIEACLDGSGITLAQLNRGPVKAVASPYIPFKGGKFRTPIGKAMLYVQDWKIKQLSPIVKYYRPVESPKGSPELFKKYPLMAIQRRLYRTINSCFGTLPWIIEAHGDKPHIMVHPEDASARGIKNGDKIAVFNDRGEHKAIAIVTQHVKKGVVVLENGWWEQQGGSSSHVTNDKPEQLGNGQSCNSTLVQLRRGA